MKPIRALLVECCFVLWCGPNCEWAIITIGALSSVVLNYGVSLSSAFTPILVFWCVDGFAQSMGFAPGSKLIANW